MRFLRFLLLCLCAVPAFAQEDCLSILEQCDDSPNLMRDLAIVQHCDVEMKRVLPVHYGFYGHAGYFNMPSARMGEEGNVVFGYSSVPPYSNYFLGFQLFKRLELSGAYRVFKGIEDQALSPFGFGDFSDKGVNVKLGLILPEDSEYLLPGLAVGWIDFLGSSRFDTPYVVLTQVFPRFGLELSLGYGWKCSRGFFGGASWMPWWKSCDFVLKNICFALEYDGHNYRIDPHVLCRTQKHPFNIGIKYLLGRYGNLFISSTRGEEIAMGIAFCCGLGATKGFLPKIEDPLPYQSPINWQKLCVLRPKESLVEDLAYAFEEQGFCLMKALIECCPDNGSKTLRVEAINLQWRYERVVHKQIAHLLAFLTPSDVDQVIAVVRTEGMAIQEYRFRREDLWRFAYGTICDPELDVLSPLREATCPPRKYKDQIFMIGEDPINYELLPRFRSFFGSARGKLKVGMDLVASVDGLLWDFLYYKSLLRYTVFSQMEVIGDRDFLNPSQLLNVNSDRIRYYQTARLFLEEAYLQRSWSMGCGFYGKVGAGLFDVAYGGFTAEVLYYPVGACWAIGVDAAALKKRTYNGRSFMRTIRKFDGTYATFVPYSFLTQYFLDFHYDFKAANLELKLSFGQFLARDIGLRTELTRYFNNGVKVGIWYTMTNGHDVLNGSRYYDKGVMLTVPFDLFLKYSSKSTWKYSMAAWLRDVGYRDQTGDSLFCIINAERQ